MLRTTPDIGAIPPLELPRLVTKRLVVRIAGPSDVEAVTRYVQVNADFLRPWEPPRPQSYYTAEYWRTQITRDVDEYARDRGIRLFLFDRTTEQRILGVATFGNVVRGAAQYCTLGYALSQAAQGQGVMREALEDAAIPFVFRNMHVHRIQANYIPRNERSGGLLRRLGFTVEGYARDYLYINGRWEDHILTSLTNQNWEPPDSSGRG